MPRLSKKFTLEIIEDSIRVNTKEISEETVKSLSILDKINIRTLELVALLNGAAEKDYLEKAILTDQLSNTSNLVTGATYADATKTIEKVGHGLTSSSIGKRIMLMVTEATQGPIGGVAKPVLLTEIVSIVDADHFTLRDAFGADINLGAGSYSVFGFYSESYLDISGLPINSIERLECSINKIVPPAKSFEFSSLSDRRLYRRSVYYLPAGAGQLLIWKGSEVPNWGTLTLWFYRTIEFLENKNEYIDLKDEHVPLLIDQVTLDVFAFAKMDAPSSVKENVDQKISKLKENQLLREKMMRESQK